MEIKNLYLTIIIVSFFLVGCQNKPNKSTPEKKTIIESTTKNSSTSSTVVGKIEKTELEKYLQSLKNEKIGIYIESLITQKNYGVNQNKKFYGASIAKLPIIFYTQEQIKKGIITPETIFNYDDSVNDIPGAMIRGGTGIMQNLISEQQSFTVNELLEWSICHSDNLASNTLSYYIANSNDKDFLATIQPFYSENLASFDKDMTAKTAGKLMHAIYKNGYHVENFSNTEWQNEKIGSLNKKTYHKIGTNNTYNHDVGVVIGESEYVLSVLTNGYSNEDIETIIANIDQLISKE